MAVDLIYKDLRKIQLMEEKTRLLTKINRDFYSDISAVQWKTDEIPDEEVQNVKRIATQIYLLREKKIILAALSKARGGRPDLRNMLDEEKNLFDSTLDILMKSRKNSIYGIEK
jgi:DNA replication initiation complex subunit (GINS family)